MSCKWIQLPQLDHPFCEEIISYDKPRVSTPLSSSRPAYLTDCLAYKYVQPTWSKSISFSRHVQCSIYDILINYYRHTISSPPESKFQFFDASFTVSVTFNQPSSPRDSIFESIWSLILLLIQTNSASLIAMAFKLVDSHIGSPSSNLSHILAQHYCPSHVAFHYMKSKFVLLCFVSLVITPLPLVYFVHLIIRSFAVHKSKIFPPEGTSFMIHYPSSTRKDTSSSAFSELLCLSNFIILKV